MFADVQCFAALKLSLAGKNSHYGEPPFGYRGRKGKNG